VAGHSPEQPFGLSDAPAFNVDAVQWRRIEKAYGSSLPPSVRTQIVRATEAYVFLQSFEQTSEGLAKAKVILEAHDKAATRFFNELFAGPSAVSDAGVYAHYLIESNFKTSELRGEARGLDVFLNLLRAFHVACNASIKQLNNPSSPAFQVGNAWNVWIDRLAEILSEAKLPVSVRNDRSKSKSTKQLPFVLFVWELQARLPTECRHPAQSEAALADALSEKLCTLR
jgi:hypothetical protein